MRLISRLLSSQRCLPPSPSVCIVGSGPAGFYSAQTLLKKGPPGLKVDIIERLPVPFGLVRFGVAPDHPEVKNVDHTFTKVVSAHKDRLRFVGNVNVGKDVKVKELRDIYDVVLLAYGAAKDKTLGIKGENLSNVVSARSFVGFYNGLPDICDENARSSNDDDLKISLDVENAAIIGIGNVGLDVARILLTPLDDLRKTDITEEALEMLSKSRVKNVYIVGRRGPVQVAFTIKELREMVNLRGCRPIFSADDFAGVRDLVPKLVRPRKRLTELLVKTVEDPPSKKQTELWKDAEKSWTLKLLRTPEEIIGDQSVTGLKLGVNRLSGGLPTADESQDVESTGEHEILDCGLVFKSIGYKSVPVEEGIPFDHKKGVIPSENGRVKGEPGLYCAGWLRTGPRGVIADTLNEAINVSSFILEDINAEESGLKRKSGPSALDNLLAARDVRRVSFEDWERIDKAESHEGLRKGKPREKLTKIDELMNASK